ncbi:MAG: IS110 family transposase [Deltaproteobacteria bacterium]|nr:IS110 family transposase [Deltaproteobacteria bacterium]
MALKHDSEIVSVVHPICCGLDVHKKEISACLLSNDAQGQVETLIAEFGTFTDDLAALRDWLKEHDCPVVALESTGIYWRPVHNVLEGEVQVVLVNARHIKNVPGRKTDIADSQWLAGLLRHGLLRGSFIPPQHVRQWRDLTRLRKSYQESLGDFKRMTHKLFESANIKLGSVVADLFGVTGRNLMNLLATREGEISLEDISQAARAGLRQKTTELWRSIQGFFTDHHRYQLQLLLSTIAALEAQVAGLQERLKELMMEQHPLLQRLKGIPGISDVAAATILAEIGHTLETFPSSAHLASWAGLCPGNNQSAGKRKSGHSPVRQHHLKTILVEVAWVTVRQPGSYYKEKFHRLRSRRGTKRAIVAIAHRLLKAIYYIIKDGVGFRDLGEEYLNRKHQASRLYVLQKQAKMLGYELVPLAA